MILQKDLSLFRLDNPNPNKFGKYVYELRYNGKTIEWNYSDNIYSIGKVSPDMTLELLTPSDVDNRVIEDDSFLVTIQN